VWVNARHTFSFTANLDTVYNIDHNSIEGVDPFDFNLSLGFNWTVRINERLRYSVRNHVAYLIEPDFNFGFAGQRGSDEILFWSHEHNLAYRWSKRFATITGISTNGVIQSNNSLEQGNRISVSAFNQFRYQLSPKTLLTAAYRGRLFNNTGRSDSDSHFITAGVEHRVSPLTVLVARGGVQFFRADDRDDFTVLPTIEAGLRTRIGEKTSLRTFVRYEITDFDTDFGANDFRENRQLAFGANVNHQYHPKLLLTGGVDVRYSELRDSDELDDTSATSANFHLGFTYDLHKYLKIRGGVNYTLSDFGTSGNSFDRIRYNLGTSVDF